MEANVRAEIRYLHTPDIDPDSFVPDDPERFMFLVQMLAGPSGDRGEESFEFTVCTPGWLHDRARSDGPITGANTVIVDGYNWAALQSFFQKLVSRCTGPTWQAVATKLGRYGRYEFEDYTPTPDGPPADHRDP
jgi:Immunity protein 8